MSDHLEIRINFKGFRPVLLLIFLNVAAFTYQVTHLNSTAFFLQALSRDRFFNGDVYLVLSSLFLHASFDHLLANIMLLFVWGIITCPLLGELRFLYFYLLGGIISNFFYILFHSGTLVGSSGAIFGLLGSFIGLLVARDTEVTKSSKMVYFAVILTTFYFFMTQLQTIEIYRIATSAHVYGFVTGYLLAKYVSSRQKQG